MSKVQIKIQTFDSSEMLEMCRKDIEISLKNLSKCPKGKIQG